jgi:hypothetical protein
MKKDKAVRFCENCQQSVIDFTQLPEREIVKHLIKNKGRICGRIYEDQLNMPLVYHQPPNKFIRRFANITASFITLFAFKQTKAVKFSTKNNITTAPVPDYSKPNSGSDKIIISGIVKNIEGSPLENAKITIGDLTYTTDKTGKFEIEITNENAGKALLIQISYEGMVPVIRNYHPAMQSTFYEVVLSTPVSGRVITQGSISTDDFKIDLLPLRYNYSSSELTIENKIILGQLAMIMRNHPEISVELSGSGKGDIEIKTMKKIQQAIKTYLVNMEGLAGERINIKTSAYNPLNKNIIEIKNCTKN